MRIDLSNFSRDSVIYLDHAHALTRGAVTYNDGLGREIVHYLFGCEILARCLNVENYISNQTRELLMSNFLKEN